MGVLQDGQAERDRRLLEQERADLGEHPLQARQAELVDLRGPLALAQADRQHLEQAALVPAGERRVRLDPVEQDDPVGLRGRSRRSGSAGRRSWSPGPTVSISQRTGQPIAASVTPSSARRARWPSAVPPPWLPIAATTKGAKPERRGASSTVARTMPVEAGDPPAADGHGDRAPGADPRGDPALADGPGDGRGDVGDLGLADVLADSGDRRQAHRRGSVPFGAVRASGGPTAWAPDAPKPLARARGFGVIDHDVGGPSSGPRPRRGLRRTGGSCGRGGPGRGPRSCRPRPGPWWARAPAPGRCCRRSPRRPTSSRRSSGCRSGG